MNPHPQQSAAQSLPEPEKTLLSALHDAESLPPVSDYEPFPPPQAARKRRFRNRTGIETIDRLPSRLTTIDYGEPVPRPPANSRDRPDASPVPSAESSQPNTTQELERHSSAVSDVLEAKLEDAWYRFEQQAQQVNYLSSRQEVAVLELRAIAQEVETLWNAMMGNAVPQSLLHVDPEASAVLSVQSDRAGAWWLTLRSIDWHLSTRYAQSTAATLRDIEQRRSDRYHGEFSPRSRSIPASPSPIPDSRPTPQSAEPEGDRHIVEPRSAIGPPHSVRSTPPIEPPMAVSSPSDSPKDSPKDEQDAPSSANPLHLMLGIVAGALQTTRTGLRRSRLRGTKPRALRSQTSQKSHRVQRPSRRVAESSSSVQWPSFTIQDAAVWIAGAAAVRILLNLVLVSQPSLQPLFLMLMVAPAAIAIYQVTSAPRTGFITAYRLLLMMVGLLLGGRLG